MFPHAELDELPPCGPEYVEYLRRTIRSTHSFAREHLRKSAIRQKRGYDAYAKARDAFQIGDYVRYYYLPLTQGNKFALPWTGPWKIVEKPTEIDYKITLVSNPEKSCVVHFDVLKPFEGDIDDLFPIEEAATVSDDSRQNATESDDVRSNPEVHEPEVDDHGEQSTANDYLDAIRELYVPWEITHHTPNRDDTDRTTAEESDDESSTESSTDDELPIAQRLRRRAKTRKVPNKMKRDLTRRKKKSSTEKSNNSTI